MDLEQTNSAFNCLVSIEKVREVFQEISLNNFKFTKITKESFKNELLKLNIEHSSTSVSILATILKQTIET